jgi:hypothetical protein
MAWAGTGVIWSISGGIPTSRAFGQKPGISKGDLTFVQISDIHIGFNKPANPDVNGTLQATGDKINSLPVQPEFIIHTGDLSHLAKATSSSIPSCRQRFLNPRLARRPQPVSHGTASGRAYYLGYDIFG